MSLFKDAREKAGWSQRNLAKKAGVSFRTLQLLESGDWDPKISTLQSVLGALGYPKDLLDGSLESFLRQPPLSVAMISRHIASEGEDTWKTWLFNFVDHFRNEPRADLIADPPSAEVSARVRALLASTVESLCIEQGREAPNWCLAVPALKEPWFPSETENLKASVFVEGPALFRKRNIFVLKNFLERA